MDNMLFKPESMQTIGNLPLMFTNEGLSWMDRAKQMDRDTLANIMQERQRKGQEFDLLQKQRQATLEGTMLGNDNTRLTNVGLGMTNRVKQATLPQEIQSKLDEFALKADSTKWTQFTNKIREGLASDDPKVRSQAEAVYNRLPDALKARQEHQRKLEIEKEQTQRAISVANIGASSREKVAGSKAGAVKIPKTPRELLTYYTYTANQMEDGPEKEQMMALAEAEWNKIQQEAILAAQAGQTGKVDPAGLSNGKIPTNPAPAPTPLPKPRAEAGTRYTLENPAKPKTQQEYNALPPGSIYVDTDGKTKRKK